MNEYWTLRQEFYKKSLRRIVAERNVPISQATDKEIRRAQGISLLGLSSCQKYFADDDYLKRQSNNGISLAIQKISTLLDFEPSNQDIELLAEVFHEVMKSSSAVWLSEFEDCDWEKLHEHVSFRLILPKAMQEAFPENTLALVADDVIIDNCVPLAFSFQNETGNLLMKKMYAVNEDGWDNPLLSKSVWQKNSFGTSILYPFLPQEEEVFRLKDLQSADKTISQIPYGNKGQIICQANMSNDLGYFEPPISVFCQDNVSSLDKRSNAYTEAYYNFTATLLMYVQIPESNQKLLIGKSNITYGFANIDGNPKNYIDLSDKKSAEKTHNNCFNSFKQNPPRHLMSGGTNILPNVAGKGFEEVLAGKLGEIAYALNVSLLHPHPQTVISDNTLSEEHKRIQREASIWMTPPQKGLQIYDLPYDYKHEQSHIIHPLKVKLLGRDILTSSRKGIYDFRELYQQEYVDISTDAYRYLIENGLIERRQKELGFLDNFKRKLGSVPEEIVSDVSNRELEFLAVFHPHFNYHIQFMLKRGVPPNILAEKRNDMMKRYLEVLDWNQNGYWTVSNQVVRAMKQIPLKNREMIPDGYPLGNIIDKRNSKHWNDKIEKFLRNMEFEVNSVCKMGRFAHDTYRLGNTLERMGIIQGQSIGSSRSEKYYQYDYDLPLVAMMQEMWKALPEFTLKPDMGTVNNFPEELKKWLPKEIQNTTVSQPVKPILRS